MKVLVIEDEIEISKSICKYLASEQFICEAAFTFEEAAEKYLYTNMPVSC